MKRNDHYSDTKVRRMFEINALALLEAKCSETALEDTRFCLCCETWYAAEFFISTVEHAGRTEFMCERCADEFDKAGDPEKTCLLDNCEITFNFHLKELKLQRRSA